MSNTVYALSHYSGDSSASLFEPDVILPGQYLDDEKGVSGGERKLMAALLSDGVEAYISHFSLASTSERSEGECEVVDWVHTRDHVYVFSFDVVCESLGIDPEYLRIGLSRYVEALKMKQAEGTQLGRAWKKIRRPRRA